MLLQAAAAGLNSASLRWPCHYRGGISHRYIIMYNLIKFDLLNHSEQFRLFEACEFGQPERGGMRLVRMSEWPKISILMRLRQKL